MPNAVDVDTEIGSREIARNPRHQTCYVVYGIVLNRPLLGVTAIAAAAEKRPKARDGSQEDPSFGCNWTNRTVQASDRFSVWGGSAAQSLEAQFDGISDKMIARVLNSTEHAVNQTIRRIHKKLRASTFREIVSQWRRHRADADSSAEDAAPSSSIS